MSPSLCPTYNINIFILSSAEESREAATFSKQSNESNALPGGHIFK